MLTEALLINAIVLATVLESDLGPHRRITRFRIWRPLLTSLLIVPFFIKGAATAGPGLVLEIGLAVAGVLVGLLAASQMTVYRSPETGEPVTRAGAGYALVWILVIAARTAFSYGSSHWFEAPLGRWMTDHHVTVDSLTDALILMAVAMVLTRVASTAARSRALRQRPDTPPRAAVRGSVLAAALARVGVGAHPWSVAFSEVSADIGGALAAAITTLHLRPRNRRRGRALHRANRRSRR